MSRRISVLAPLLRRPLAPTAPLSLAPKHQLQLQHLTSRRPLHTARVMSAKMQPAARVSGQRQDVWSVPGSLELALTKTKINT